jgi:hypothetical protein
MIILETQTILPYLIEDVFALTVDLEKAPRWHAILTVVQQLTTPPIGMGTRWKMHYAVESDVGYTGCYPVRRLPDVGLK